jgi:hypothetical protein
VLKWTKLELQDDFIRDRTGKSCTPSAYANILADPGWVTETLLSNPMKVELLEIEPNMYQRRKKY